MTKWNAILVRLVVTTRPWVSCNNNETLQPNPNTLHTHTHTRFIMANTITDSNKLAYTNTMFKCSISIYYGQYYDWQTMFVFKLNL